MFDTAWRYHILAAVAIWLGGGFLAMPVSNLTGWDPVTLAAYAIIAAIVWLVLVAIGKAALLVRDRTHTDSTTDDRARVTYVDAIMTFGSLVAFIAVAPWTYDIIAKIQGTADPLTGTLAALVPPVLLIALLISIGVSGRSR